MEFFGFEIKRKDTEEKEQKKRVSFVPPSNDDGSLVVAEGGVYGTYIDLDGTIRTEAELVTKYRAIALDPIVDLAIQDIVNEAIVEDSDEETIALMLDDLDVPKNIKSKIQDEFDNLLNLLEFNSLSYEIFRRWYIDGRLYYHVMIDEDKPKEGIKELRYVDPRNIKKVREVKKEKTKEGVNVERIVAEYYVYNKTGFLKNSGSYSNYSIAGASTSSAGQQGLKIAKDSIVYCTSGFQGAENSLILSYLHKAIRPMNQLRSLEDSLVIYRISRAPERRIFYVDVGGLPKAKAEQYLRDIMAKFKNKVVYDSETGEIRDDRKFMTMLEDFWLPRREGGRGTEITTLPGGQNLGDIDDILYFQNLLYRSLNVPATRLQPDQTFSLGRATEITRDEVKFYKFIQRLRNRFATLFNDVLRKQLLLKGVIAETDWDDLNQNVVYDFNEDSYFNELRDTEILKERLQLLGQIDPLVGKYYSTEYVRKHILQQSEEEITLIDSQNTAERQKAEMEAAAAAPPPGMLPPPEAPAPAPPQA